MAITTYFSRAYQSGQSTLTRASRPAHPFAEGIDPTAPTTLTIKSIRYSVECFDGCDNTQVVRLTKMSGKNEVYDVSRGETDGLVSCDCPSFEMTYRGTVSTCKHGTAVVEAGLLKPAKPVARPMANLPQVEVNRVAPVVSKILDKPTSMVEVKPEPVKSDTMSEIKSATVAEVTTSPIGDKPAVRIWTEADWKRAEYFKLRPPVGQTRPKPVPVVVETVAESQYNSIISTEPVSLATDASDMVVETVAESASSVVDPSPTIPAEVDRIRVLEGSAAGLWVRQPKRGRWIWAEESGDLDLSDTARWLACTVADAWFVSGMVELLPDRHPIKPTTPKASKPRVIVPSLDEIWNSAWLLGQAGIAAAPCKTWVDAAKLAFLDGFYWGDLQRDADHEEDAESRQEMAYA